MLVDIIRQHYCKIYYKEIFIYIRVSINNPFQQNKKLELGPSLSQEKTLSFASKNMGTH